MLSHEFRSTYLALFKSAVVHRVHSGPQGVNWDVNKQFTLPGLSWNYRSQIDLDYKQPSPQSEGIFKKILFKIRSFRQIQKMWKCHKPFKDTRHPLEGTLEMLEKRVHKLAEHNSGDKGRGNNVDEGKCHHHITGFTSWWSLWRLQFKTSQRWPFSATDRDDTQIITIKIQFKTDYVWLSCIIWSYHIISYITCVVIYLQVTFVGKTIIRFCSYCRICSLIVK